MELNIAEHTGVWVTQSQYIEHFTI